MSELDQNRESQPNPYEVLKAGQDILDHFEVSIDPVEEPEKFILALQQLDPRFQGGRELVRWQLEQDQTAWPETTQQVIMRAAEAMRMTAQETPLSGQFDAVIALGGARQSNLDRARYAVECVHRGEAAFKHLIVAGSARKLNDQEQEATASYAPGAKTEFDLCVGAAKTIAEENPGLIVSFAFIEDERAGTPAVIEQVMADLERSDVVRYGDAAIAAVTTQIYQESTSMDLRRMAKKHGITNYFAAGNPSDPKIVAARKPATYLTEVIRTLKAATMAIQEEAA